MSAIEALDRIMTDTSILSNHQGMVPIILRIFVLNVYGTILDYRLGMEIIFFLHPLPAICLFFGGSFGVEIYCCLNCYAEIWYIQSFSEDLNELLDIEIVM